MLFPLHLIIEPKSDPLQIEYGRDKGLCQREIRGIGSSIGDVQDAGCCLCALRWVYRGDPLLTRGPMAASRSNSPYGGRLALGMGVGDGGGFARFVGRPIQIPREVCPIGAARIAAPLPQERPRKGESASSRSSAPPLEISIESLRAPSNAQEGRQVLRPAIQAGILGCLP